jgi:hypothetical protein
MQHASMVFTLQKKRAYKVGTKVGLFQNVMHAPNVNLRTIQGSHAC